MVQGRNLHLTDFRMSQQRGSILEGGGGKEKKYLVTLKFKIWGKFHKLRWESPWFFISGFCCPKESTCFYGKHGCIPKEDHFTLVPVSHHPMGPQQDFIVCIFNFGQYPNQKAAILKYRAHFSCRKQDNMTIFSKNECVKCFFSNIKKKNIGSGFYFVMVKKRWSHSTPLLKIALA